MKEQQFPEEKPLLPEQRGVDSDTVGPPSLRRARPNDLHPFRFFLKWRQTKGLLQTPPTPAALNVSIIGATAKLLLF